MGRAWSQTPTGVSGTCIVCHKEYPRKKGDRPDRILCGRLCANKYSSLVSLEARAEKLRGHGGGKAYPKLRGRHAHRVVAEKILGRKLRSGEVVHHKNGDRLDYRESNLEVLPSQSAHAIEHDLGHKRSGFSIYEDTTCKRCSIPWAPERKFTKGFCKVCYLQNYREGVASL